MATVYKSKIDWWLGLVLAIAMVASLFAGLKALSAGTPHSAWLALLIGGPGLLLPLSVLLSTRYIVSDKQLVVRSGIFTWRIPISEICGISQSSDPIASPALSLDRLRIDYGKGKSLLISPRDQVGFLAHVASLNRGAV
jgi:hypothetical protein